MDARTINFRALWVLSGLWSLVSVMAPTLLQAGEIRYDRTKRPIKLVAHLRSELPKKSFWVVTDENKKLKIVDLGVGGSIRKRWNGVGEPPRFPPLSQAEWAAMQQRVPEILKGAEPSLKLTGIETQDRCDVESEASDAEGAGLALGKDDIKVQMPRTRSGAPSVPRTSEKSVDNMMGNILMQIRSKLIWVAAPSMVLFSGLMIAFPKLASAIWKIAKIGWVAISAALQILEKALDQVSSESWGFILVFLGVLWLVGGHRLSMWIKNAMSSGAYETPKVKKEAADLDVAAMWRDRQLDDGDSRADEPPRSGVHQAYLESSGNKAWQYEKYLESQRKQDEVNAAMLGALDRLGERIDQIGSAKMDGVNSAKTDGSRFPVGAGMVQQPAEQSPLLPPPPNLDNEFAKGLRQRALAYEQVRAEDSGEGPRVNVEPKVEESKQQATLFSELQAAQRRIQNRSSDPLEKLKKMQLKEIDVGVVDSRLAPTYLLHLYHSNKHISDYFDKFFSSRNCMETPLHKETRRLANALDDMCYSDNCDLINSVAVERLARRLYGVEVALQNVHNKNDLNSKAEWVLADELDMDQIEQGTFNCRSVVDEARKRLEQKANVSKWIAKAKEK